MKRFFSRIAAAWRKLHEPPPKAPSVCACCWRHECACGPVSAENGFCQSCTANGPPPSAQPASAYRGVEARRP